MQSGAKTAPNLNPIFNNIETLFRLNRGKHVFDMFT